MRQPLKAVPALNITLVGEEILQVLTSCAFDAGIYSLSTQLKGIPRVVITCYDGLPHTDIINIAKVVTIVGQQEQQRLRRAGSGEWPRVLVG